jgi:hypothetical protein
LRTAWKRGAGDFLVRFGSVLGSCLWMASAPRGGRPLACRDSCLVGLGGEVLPAGEGRQGERFGLGEAVGIGLLPFELGQVLLRPVVPDALQGQAGEQGRGRVDAWGIGATQL